MTDPAGLLTAPPAALAQLRAAGIVDPALADTLAHGLIEVEERLAEAVVTADVLASETTNHLLRAGGKRTRPLLCLLAAQLGTAGPQVIDAAVVVELTHLATLYHDDVMDSAPVRRGVPAAHAVWGNTVAILSGDLLFARASRVCASLGPAAVLIQSATFERLCLGQLHETVGPGAADPVLHYLQVLSDKTGSLIATACRFGAMFAGCDAATVDVLVRYGEAVGTAFQLADDVLDLAADPDESGKTPGTDLREGVATLPVLMLRALAADGREGAEGRRILDLLDAGVESDDDLVEAVTLLRGHEAMQQAHVAARRAAGDAVDTLVPLPRGPVREALEAVAESLADRLA